MSERVCLVHYHEIGLKGKNRFLFEEQLQRNLRAALKSCGLKSIRRISGHLLVRFLDDEAGQEVLSLIAATPGVARVSLCYMSQLDFDEFAKNAVQALREAEPFYTFKVQAKRSNTAYELHTMDLNQRVGSILCKEFPAKRVDVHIPDATVHVLINENHAYVWCASQKGVGGLPVGTAGKCVSLFSSGFDSPVASWMMGRRGAIIIPLHFSGRPQTADTSEWLCKDIIGALSPSACIGRLYVVPFGDIQRDIALAVPNELRILMYRRVMFSVAQKLAMLEGAKALVTGESLGQVASQTLENIEACASVVTNLPILRPLIGTDKQEIIERAHKLGTFDICAETAPDCCTLFMPRRPETHASMKRIITLWASLNYEEWIERAYEGLEYIDFGTCPAYKPPKQCYHYHQELKSAFE